MNIVWEHGELAGPKWQAHVEPPTRDGGFVEDFFYLNVWPLVVADDVHPNAEWAWEIVYFEDCFSMPKIMASGVASDSDPARWAAFVALGTILRESDQIDFWPDEHPIDRVR